VIYGAVAMRFAGRWPVLPMTVFGTVSVGKERSGGVGAALSSSSQVVVSGLYV
jgi:hypothetical protein